VIKKEKKKIFDPATSQNMTIMLKRMPPPEEMIVALQDMTTMDLTLISRLISAWPEVEDIGALIEDHQNNPEEEFDLPETYFLNVLSIGIDDIKPKLDVMKFINEYKQE
jgi:hypothetical protein